MGAIGIGAFVTALLAVISNVVALAGPEWWKYAVPGAKVYLGLWTVCFSDMGFTSCSDLPTGAKCDSNAPSCELTGDCSMCDKLNAARAATILAFIAGVVLLILAGKAGFRSLGDMARMIAIGLAVWCGFWMMIAMALGADMKDELSMAYLGVPVMDYGYAFALAVLGWILYWVTAPLMWFGKE